MEYQECTKCEEVLPATTEYFYMVNRKNKKRGKFKALARQCKRCYIEKASEWQKENPERHIIAVRKDQEKPERQAYMKELTKRHEADGTYKKWRRENPDKLRVYGEKRKEKNHEITNEEWLECLRFFGDSCAYCGISMDEHKEIYNQRLHMEHVEHDGSNKIDNCVPSCKSCNGSKHINDMYEWYSQQDFFDESKLNKIYEWIELKTR